MMDHDYASFSKAVSEKKLEDIERPFPLASKGVKRQNITGDEFDPLHSASSPEIVRSIISGGVDVNVKNFKTDETPLLTVIKLKKSPAVIRELLKHGASIEARNKHTLNTPLNQAAQICNCPPETIQALLEYGASINTANKHCDTPLHNACRYYRGDLRIVDMLLKSGSPVNFKNLRGETPLNASLQNPLCTAELVRALLKFNAKVDVKMLRYSLQILHDDYLNIVSELIQHATITSPGQWTSIVLHLLRKVRNKEKMTDCGKLIIKQMFLKSDDLHKSIHPSSIHFLPHFPFRCLRIVAETVNINKRNDAHASACGKLESFTEDCFSEIECMKTDMLENNTSIYQLIVSKTGKVRLEDKIVKILKENTYPIYRNVIINKIKRAALLDKLFLQQVYAIVQHGDVARRIVLDAFSVSNIAKYLNVDDIKNFIDAFCDTFTDKYCFWDDIEKMETRLSTKPRICRSATKKRLSSPTGHSSSKVQKKSSPLI